MGYYKLRHEMRYLKKSYTEMFANGFKIETKECTKILNFT